MDKSFKKWTNTVFECIKIIQIRGSLWEVKKIEWSAYRNENNLPGNAIRMESNGKWNIGRYYKEKRSDRKKSDNASEKERFALQQEYLKDVVYIFIATVCYDLAASHDMIDMTRQEVEDYQLAKDLQHAKAKLTVIDGGKK